MSTSSIHSDIFRFKFDWKGAIIIAMKTIVFTIAAAKEFDALPLRDREAVCDALSDYAMTGEGDVLRLSGRPGYRMRVGAYRIVFAEDMTTILALYIGRRSTTTYRRH
jgi:mRNA interferase RelE/StbE